MRVGPRCRGVTLRTNLDNIQSALAAQYEMSFAAVQKHVAVLEKAGLITKRRSGREQLASGDVTAGRSVASMLTEFEQVWRGRIARIDDLIASETKED